MGSYRPINCHLHDYLEIACLYRYRLLIELVDGSRLESRAISTETRPSKEEYLLLQDDSGEHALRLDRLQAITPLTPGGALRPDTAGQPAAGMSTSGTQHEH